MAKDTHKQSPSSIVSQCFLTQMAEHDTHTKKYLVTTEAIVSSSHFDEVSVPESILQLLLIKCANIRHEVVLSCLCFVSSFADFTFNTFLFF